MKNPKNRKQKSFIENLSKVVIISEIPKLAKLVVDLIPDLTYERYVKEYKSIWNLALPAASLIVLNKYEGTETEKTFIACMSAGISRAINERLADANKVIKPLAVKTDYLVRDFKQTNSKEAPDLKIKDCLDLLDSGQFSLFLNRLESLPEEQRNGILNINIPSDENVKELISMFNTLAKNETLASLRGKNPGRHYSLDSVKSMKVLYIKFCCLDLDDESFKYFAQSIFSREGRDRTWQKAVQRMHEKGINVL